ncbi:MAG: tRNA lysidine(34) synthetase TilS, partial [Magnetospirillum sp.]
MIAGPLSADDFAGLMARLGPFESRPRLAVAVSGGGDSLALVLLAAEWAGAQGGEVVAVTVDHRLRPASGEEAARVGHWLGAHGIGHRTLTWDGMKPAADLQAAARRARYELLGAFCRSAGILHLLLAHHREDQAETLLLRLGRGSGVDGLAAMAMDRPTRWGRLLRPLLDTPRQRLRATLSVRGQPWIEDPSNSSAVFARVRLRQLAPALAAEGLGADRLAATARRLARVRDALEQAVAEAACRSVVLHPAGFARCDAAVLARLPDEIGLRLLARLVSVMGGGEYG